MSRTHFFILGLVLTVLWSVMPFRLMGLTAEMFLVKPTVTRFTQEDNRYWQALDLEARIEAMGWNVTYIGRIVVGDQAAYGATFPEPHAIFVLDALHWNARAAVLAHEMGHTLEPGWVNRTEGDCFAEGVATLVMRDGLREHARFLANSRWTCLGLFLTEFPAIYHAAAALTD